MMGEDIHLRFYVLRHCWPWIVGIGWNRESPRRWKGYVSIYLGTTIVRFGFIPDWYFPSERNDNEES